MPETSAKATLSADIKEGKAKAEMAASIEDDARAQLAELERAFREGKIDIVELGERRYAMAEKMGVPLVGAYRDLLHKIFRIADDLGIGREVRILYYSISVGAEVGAAAPAATARFVASIPGLSAALARAGLPTAFVASTQLGGSAIASLGAAAGMSAGMVAGAVIALFSLFGGDGEDEERKRKREVAARKALRHLLDRLDFKGLASEQEAVASEATAMSVLMGPIANAELRARFGDPKKLRALADVSRKFAAFYRELGKQLAPNEAALFLSLVNRGRWQGAYDALMRLPVRQRAYLNLAAGAELAISLRQRIAEEEARLEKLALTFGPESALSPAAEVVFQTESPRPRPKIDLSSLATRPSPWGRYLKWTGVAAGIVAATLAGKALIAHR